MKKRIASIFNFIGAICLVVFCGLAIGFGKGMGFMFIPITSADIGGKLSTESSYAILGDWLSIAIYLVLLLAGSIALLLLGKLLSRDCTETR